MAYIVQSDLLVQLSERQLVELTDDLKQGVVDTDKTARAIADAEAEINGYLLTQYAVPLVVPIPALVKKLAIDIAVYNLYRRRQRIPEDVRQAYEDAVRKLEGIAKGLITLGVEPVPTVVADVSYSETFGDERIFTRTSLGSF